MNEQGKRRVTATLLIVIASISATGCVHYGDGRQPPSVLNDPPPNLAYQCQIANRDVTARVAMPALRGRCGAWADRQTSVLGL